MEFFRLKDALSCKLDDKPVKTLKRLPSVYFILKGGSITFNIFYAPLNYFDINVARKSACNWFL